MRDTKSHKGRIFENLSQPKLETAFPILTTIKRP
jgi:hypothetical protein